MTALVCQGRTVAAAVPGTAHGIPIAALLPPAAVEAAGRGVMRAVAVASHAALLVVAAWIHLLEKQKRAMFKSVVIWMLNQPISQVQKKKNSLSRKFQSLT